MPTALLVEDDDDQATLLAFRLRDLDYRVARAKTVEQALQILEAYVPDVVLVDLVLGDQNGWELVSQLRAQDQFHDLPIVVISGWVADARLKRNVALYRCHYLPKPFTGEELTAMLRHAPVSMQPDNVRREH